MFVRLWVVRLRSGSPSFGGFVSVLVVGLGSLLFPRCLCRVGGSFRYFWFLVLTTFWRQDGRRHFLTWTNRDYSYYVGPLS